MELALYHPELGYYCKAARQDDYYTNADVHAVFGDILARFLAAHGAETIVELGAGEGKLCRLILKALQTDFPEIHKKCSYVCVEKSPARRQACAEAGKDFPGKITVKENFDFGPGSINGVILSNEFFDALPFHRAYLELGAVKEVQIGKDFEEILAPASKEVREYFDWLNVFPQEGAYAEVQIACRDWMGKIGRAMKKGVVLSIDYGFETRELFSEARPLGTALCHFKHSTNREYYERIGDQDITAHVNFSVLMKEGEKQGLKPTLMSQSRFILNNGFEEAVKKLENVADPRARLRLSSAIKSLVHPESMGGAFKVLLQKMA